MITNERQYKIVKSQIESFQESLNSFSASIADMKDVHPMLIDAQRNAIASKLDELIKEVQEYEAIKDGQLVTTQINNLADLPLALIKARIANGYSQSQLAQKLGLKEQQIQRYEAEKYETASLKTLIKIASILNINISADIQLKEIESPDMFNVSQYPFKQMFQRRWFSNFTGSFNDAVKNSARLLQSLYEGAGLENLQVAFTKKTIRSGGKFNEYALNAWYAHVINKARDQELRTFFNKESLTSEMLTSLAQLSNQKDGERIAVERLKELGIRIVMESQLEGTHLDGAALLMDQLYPVIALTLRHDRVDNFWFVLFHELGHVVLHLGKDCDKIFDDLDATAIGIEKEADQFALESLIPNEIWRKSLVRFSPSNQTITNLAKSLEVSPALVAGRIRKETGKFYDFTDLVGQGKIRKQFENELN